MRLSEATIDAICTRFGWDWCRQYGERGYGSYSGEGTTRVVLGSYWLRPGDDGWHDKLRNPERLDDPWPLAGMDRRWPLLFAQLKEQGVELQWRDEWQIDYEHDKAYRTTAEGYDWTPSFVHDDYGEMITPDHDIDTWIAWALNSTDRCLADSMVGDVDAKLTAAGYQRWNDDPLENGWHPGQDDTPQDAARRIRIEHPNADVIFTLDEASQFYSRFSAWYRNDTEEVAA
jgi:hypothetical protein